MLSATTLVSLLLSSAAVQATIFVISPVDSTTVKGGKTLAIEWEEDNSTPLASTFGPTTVGLYVGTQISQTEIQTLGTIADPGTTQKLTATLPATLGPDGKVYFIRFQSVSATDSTGAPLQAFSSKFTLEDMTGNFSPAISSQIAGLSSAAAAATSAAGSLPAVVGNTTTTVVSQRIASPTAGSASAASASSHSNSSFSESGAVSVKAAQMTGVAGAVVGLLGYFLAAL